MALKDALLRLDTHLDGLEKVLRNTGPPVAQRANREARRELERAFLAEYGEHLGAVKTQNLLLRDRERDRE
jgi:hypothetical protein